MLRAFRRAYGCCHAEAHNVPQPEGSRHGSGGNCQTPKPVCTLVSGPSQGTQVPTTAQRSGLEPTCLAL